MKTSWKGVIITVAVFGVLLALVACAAYAVVHPQSAWVIPSA